jgi:hypothetical protein
MRPALRFVIPFAIGLAIPGGLWAYTAWQGRGERGAMEDKLEKCQKVAGTIEQAESRAGKAEADLTTCRGDLDAARAATKGTIHYCALPDPTGVSSCFATRPECEKQATACREQPFAMCSAGRCYSDVWGCVKQATGGQACEVSR